MTKLLPHNLGAWLLIIVILLAALVGSMALKSRYGGQVKNANSNIANTNQNSNSNTTSDQGTTPSNFTEGVSQSTNHYQNKLAGLSFDFPSNWGPINTYKSDAGNEQIKTGSLMEMYPTKSNDSVWIYAYTPDLSGQYTQSGFDYTDISKACNTYQNCKVFKAGSLSYAWINKLDAPECSPEFVSHIYLLNPQNKYKDIEIAFRLDDVENMVLKTYDCTAADGDKESVRQAKIWSDKIFSNDASLSQNDRAMISNIKVILNSLKLSK